MRVTFFLIALLFIWQSTVSYAQISDSSDSIQFSCSPSEETEVCPQSMQVDGILVEIVRLIKEPNTKNDLRAIVRLVNLDAPNSRVAIYFPTPELVDQLGNPYFAAYATGIPFCTSASIAPRFGSDQIFFDLRECSPRETAETAIRAAQDVPLNMSVIFTPENSRMFSRDLAQLSTFASVRFRLARFEDGSNEPNTMDIFFARVPLPR